jgi:hypothetical protein
MKKQIIVLLIFSLLLCSTGCGAENEDHPRFYYLRTQEEIIYGDPQGLVAPVTREISRDTNLDVILQLYLDGTGEEGWRNPIPRGTHLLSTLIREDQLDIVLSHEFSTLDGIQLTLAGACLAATCYDLTGMERIHIRSGDNVYDFDLNSFVFLDTNP